MKPSAEPSIRSLCVYCGSSNGHQPAFLHAAEVLGRSIAEANLRLVYGGGDNGLMGAVARAVLANSGEVTGIIPEFLVAREQTKGAKGLEGADMITVPDMHTRKHMMFDKADAFIALPGGIGTLEEIVEMLTWAQLRRHEKPVALLDVDGFWQPLSDLLDHMETSGFLHNAAKARPRIFSNAEEVVPGLLSV